MDDVKWYRVIDPLNPLFGCDVSGTRVAWDSDTDETLMISVRKMRRVDVFVGDRPFQLIAPQGETLGLWIDVRHLADSPLQDDVVELATDLPYGECLDEEKHTRGDGLTVHVVTYEHAAQVALLDANGKLLKTRTTPGLSVPNTVLSMFEQGRSADEILEYMTGGDADGEEGQ